MRNKREEGTDVGCGIIPPSPAALPSLTQFLAWKSPKDTPRPQVDPTTHRAEAAMPAPTFRASPSTAENECRMTREEGAQSRNERVRDQAHNLNRFARSARGPGKHDFIYSNPPHPPRHSCYAARDRCLLPNFSPRADRMIRPERLKA